MVKDKTITSLFKLVITCTITGMLFTCITLLWRNVDEIHTDETFVLRLCRNLKKTRNISNEYIGSRYLLINTIEPQQYQDDNNYTDRKKLLTLLRILNKHHNDFKFIVIDVLFDKSSRNKSVDDSLALVMDQLQEKEKIIYSGIWNEKDSGFLYQINEPIVSSVGDVGYQAVEDKFYQYKHCVFGTQIKSLPFLMHQKNQQFTLATNRWGLIKTVDIDGKTNWYFNTFTPEIFFNREDFDTLIASRNGNEMVNQATTYADLSSITSNPESADHANPAYDTISRMHELFSAADQRNKIIFIGDFSAATNDSHSTTEGSLKGPELIINILYNIEQGNSRITWFHILFLFTGYSILSLFIFRPIHIKPSAKQSKKQTIFWLLFDILFIEHLSYIILILISMLSYLLFSHIINVLTLGILIFLISSAIKVRKELTK